MQDVSVLIGGKAGDGAKNAGNMIGRIFNRLGFYVFVMDDYQSLIRGGHNFSVVKASEKKVWNNYREIDLLIALNEDTIKKHGPDLSKNGLVIFDKDTIKYDKKGAVPAPLSTMLKEVGGLPFMISSAAIGVMTHLYNIPLKVVEKTFEEVYKKKAEKNIQLIEKGYEYAKNNFKVVKEIKPIKNKLKPLLTGNEAIALGAVSAGLDTYIAYPMTPSTSILHFLTAHKNDFGLTVVQPENEISVINMALGSAYAGSRTMIGTSGGGFALMQEAFSLAGMSETPLVVVESQRTGPSTGVPTYTAQADLKFTLNAGHGEFPRILIAPGDTEEAFYKTAEALNLAWEYQVPVIILTDKHLSESTMTTEIDEKNMKIEKGKISTGSKNYKRYENIKDGISPMAFPGSQAVVKATSYEHDEYGYTTEEPAEIVLMQEKRFEKMDSLIKDLKKKETVKVYGKGKDLVISWGSSKGAVLEAMKLMKKPVKFLQIIYIEPFPVWEVEKDLRAAKKTVCVEANYTGQLASIIREKTGHSVDHKILKYDSRAFEPVELSKELNKVLK